MLFGGYDRSPSTWALHADIHCHIVLEITVHQQDKDSVSLQTTLMYESSLASDAILTMWCTMMTSASSWFVFRSSLWRLKLLHTCTGVGFGLIR